MRLPLSLVVLALVATAASFGHHIPQLRIVDRGRMVFRPAAVPRSQGAAIGTDNFAFLSSRVGFAATTGGAGWLPKVGYEQPTDAGRIEITADGGATWRTVWARRHVVFGAISFAGRRFGLAAGTMTTGTNPQPPRVTPILVATSDGGRSWHELPRPPFPGWFVGQQDMYSVAPVGTLQLPSRNAWFVFATNSPWPPSAHALWRSTDQGVHWHRVWIPPGTSAVAFSSPHVGYVAAWPRTCRTAQELWKTVDGGSTWKPLPGTCGPVYTSLDFLDPRRGFTSESIGGQFDAYAQHVVIRATTDGGAHWQTRYRAGRWWQVYTRLAFSNTRQGWATSDEWDQGFEHASVHVTTDGGRTWRSVPYPGLPEGFYGASAWVGPWRTADWGRTWRVSLRPDQIFPRALRLAFHGRLDVDADMGTLESRDDGHTWQTRPPLSALSVARATHARAFVQPAGNEFHFAVAYLRTQRGWRPLAPTRFYQAGDAAFRDARHGLVSDDQERAPVYRTADGGRTWAKVRLPAGVAADIPVVLAPGTILIPDALDPPGTSILFVSIDDGRHWQRFAIRGTEHECSLSRPTRASIWILCAPFGDPQTTLLRSDDGGAHWIRLTGRSSLDPSQMIADGPRSAWTLGVTDWSRGTGPPLWHTADGGRTWHAVWPQLSPRNRVYGLRPS